MEEGQPSCIGRASPPSRSKMHGWISPRVYMGKSSFPTPASFLSRVIRGYLHLFSHEIRTCKMKLFKKMLAN